MKMEYTLSRFIWWSHVCFYEPWKSTNDYIPKSKQSPHSRHYSAKVTSGFDGILEYRFIINIKNKYAWKQSVRLAFAL